jgi:hypothetical protein
MNRTETCMRTASFGDFHALPSQRHWLPSLEVSTAQHSSFPSDMGPRVAESREKPSGGGQPFGRSPGSEGSTDIYITTRETVGGSDRASPLLSAVRPRIDDHELLTDV